MFKPEYYYRFILHRGTALTIQSFGTSSPDICYDDIASGKCNGTPYLIIQADREDPPTISELQQYRQFGIDSILNNGTFVGNAAVFKANILDVDSAEVKLEVELKPIDTPFDGVNTIISEPQATGTVTLAHDELIPIAEHYEAGGNEKSFHWRARAVDAEGNTSAWQEFDTNPSPDFTAKVVPLYTQITSDFPKREDEDEWSRRIYASGVDFDCSPNDPQNANIARCGCAISSLVMIARYHGLEKGIDGNYINPLNINAWLQANNGYIGDNLVSWPKVEEYLGVKINGEPHATLAFDRENYKTNSLSVINSYLSQEVPVIAFSSTAGHYFVVDSNINSQTGTTRTVRDPRWYRTKTLNDTQNLANEVKGYNNTFAHATIFTKNTEPKKIAAHTELYLASPAELLVTDPQGRRVGKDPVSGSSYDEVPGGVYALEDPISTSDTDLDPDTLHHVKSLFLPELSNGTYNVQVLGTGEGLYTLTAVMTNDAGDTATHSYISSTTVGQSDGYNLFSENGEQRITEKYEWYGFSQPINDIGQNSSQMKSVFKAGSTIPVKFQLYRNGVLAQASTSPRWLTPEKGSAMSAVIDESVYTGTGTTGTEYRFDSISQHYIYNWSTKGLAAGYWYRIYAKLDDGTTQSVIVGLR